MLACESDKHAGMCKGLVAGKGKGLAAGKGKGYAAADIGKGLAARKLMGMGCRVGLRGITSECLGGLEDMVSRLA